MVEPGGCCAKLNKLDTEGQMLCDSTYVRPREQSNTQRGKENRGCPGLGEGPQLAPTATATATPEPKEGERAALTGCAPGARRPPAGRS